MKILNLGSGSGRIKPLVIEEKKLDHYFLLHVDRMEVDGFKSDFPKLVEMMDNFSKQPSMVGKQIYEYMLPCYTWEKFSDVWPIKFDYVSLYRILEHVSMRDVLYFLYCVANLTEIGGEIDIIVPNMKVLSKLLLQEDVTTKSFEATNILLTTEILNEPYDPHASLWTPDRIRYFTQLENRFEVINIIDEFEFDGRSIYLRATLKRI
jgi:hypothetical protein